MAKFTKLIKDGSGGADIEEWDGSGIVIEEVPEENLISFTIDGTEYSAKEGMIWSRWTDSKYNTKDFSVVDNTVRTGNSQYHSYVIRNGARVVPTDLIIDGGEYGIEPWSSGGSNE